MHKMVQEVDKESAVSLYGSNPPFMCCSLFLMQYTLWIKPTLIVVFTVPDRIHTLWIKPTLNVVFPVPDTDIQTQMVEADDVTTMVINSKVAMKMVRQDDSISVSLWGI